MRHHRLLARTIVVVGLSTLIPMTGCEAGLEHEGSQTPSLPPAGEGQSPPADGSEPASQEPAAPGPLMLVMDASGSMNESGPDGQPLLDSAKQALHDLVDALPDEQEVGLRVYGHRVPNTDKENGCQDTELIHPVSPLDRDALNQAIDSYDAVGYTPIGLSLEQASGDLPPEGDRTIVLVSDGEDTCAPPDPCDVARDLHEAGVELIINTVGFALGGDDQARQQLECIADAGGGVYQDAGNAAELADALEESARDRREAQLAGDVLEGAPLPRDAATGEIDTAYTDTVLGDETNYYRFEVPPGSEARGEVIINFDHAIDGCQWVSGVASLTDAGDQELSSSRLESLAGGEASTLHTDRATIDAGEVWIKIVTEPNSHLEENCGSVELESELRLTIL